MALRETVRSLMAYFILSGLVSGLLNTIALVKSQAPVAKAIAVVGLGFAIAYVYAGVRLRSLLATSPTLVLRLLIAGAVFLAALFGVSLLDGSPGSALPTTILGLAVTAYLFVNVRRLAAESRPEMAAPVGS